jgi:RimJ/RimL family protein N-acetyltransferase
VISTDQLILRLWFDTFFNVKSREESTFIGRVREGKVIACTSYSNFNGNSCDVHIASSEKHWLSKEYLRVIFDYPFNQLNLRCIMAYIHADNEKSLGLCRHLGFSKVAEIPNAHALGDLVLMAMQRDECKFLLKEAA